MAYTPHTPADVEAMLAAIGADSIDALFSDVPEQLLRKDLLELPARNEFEVVKYFEKAEPSACLAPWKLLMPKAEKKRVSIEPTRCSRARAFWLLIESAMPSPRRAERASSRS